MLCLGIQFYIQFTSCKTQYSQITINTKKFWRHAWWWLGWEKLVSFKWKQKKPLLKKMVRSLKGLMMERAVTFGQATQKHYVDIRWYLHLCGPWSKYRYPPSCPSLKRSAQKWKSPGWAVGRASFSSESSERSRMMLSKLLNSLLNRLSWRFLPSIKL